MTFGYVKVLVCFHYVFLYVSSQLEEEKEEEMWGSQKKEMMEAGGKKKYRAGEVEIVSKIYVYSLSEMAYE